MKKNEGFSSFEFYFVVALIGLLMLIAIQRYFRLAEQTQRFGFELLAQNFSAAVYSNHGHWILITHHLDKNIPVNKNGDFIQFNSEGWPIGSHPSATAITSVEACAEIWKTLLQNPDPLSYEGGDPYGSRPYHLTYLPPYTCRYEMITANRNEYYFDYVSQTGQVLVFTPLINKAR